MKVLIVDDEADICQALSMVCERAGLQVSSTQDPASAIKLLETEKPDVLITDIIMPEIDGIAILKTARQMLPGIRVIAISGGGEQGPDAYKPAAISTNAFLSAARDAGADSVITKPFSRKDILAAIGV